MPQYSVATNLCRLAKDFQSGDPVQATAIKKDFKNQTKNDVVRAVVYLMEVVGSRDAQYQKISNENKDLKELLDLRAPGWDKEDGDTNAQVDSTTTSTTMEKADGTAQTNAN